MANTATIQIRIDKDVKEKAEKVFASMGMSMSTGLRLFIYEVVRRQCIPFDITPIKKKKK